MDKGYYRWTFRDLHKRVRIGEELEVGTVFREPEYFSEFWSENYILELVSLA